MTHYDAAETLRQAIATVGATAAAGGDLSTAATPGPRSSAPTSAALQRAD